MRVTRFPDAAAFLSATHDFRAAQPVFTNIIGSVAESVVAGRVYESEAWWGITDEGDDLVGIAMRTAPWNLSVSPMPEDAASGLGRLLATEDPHLPGITGPADVVDAVRRGLDSSRRSRVVMVDVARVLGTYRPPTRPDGGARLATDADLGLLVAWHVRFAEEAGLPAHDVESSVAARLAEGALWLWESAGEPVAMAGHASLVPTPMGAVGRVGPVYTPTSERGRGYGSAITAAVVEGLQARCALIMLFADASRPDVNRIYERLGFEAVGELVELEFDD